MRILATPASPELDQALLACRHHILAAVAFSFCLNLLYLTAPIYALQIYDRILPSGSESTLLMLTLAAMLALAVLAALDALRAHILARSGVRFDRRMAGRMLDVSVERALVVGPAEHGQGLRDLALLRQGLSGQAALAAFDLPWVPVYLGALYLIHWALGTVALLFGAVLVGLAILNDRVTRGAVEQARAASAAGQSLLDAGLRNAEAIRAMGMSADFERRWSRSRIDEIGGQLAAGDRAAVVASAIKFVRIAAQILMLGIGAFLAIRQVVSPGAIFAATILLARAIQPFEQVVGGWHILVGAVAAYRRVGVLLGLHRTMPESVELPRPAGALSVEAAGFVPPGSNRPVLQGITFNLGAGETLGVIGPTAAGKSTLARLLVGICPPSAGEVRIDGASAFRWARGSLGRHVGYLPQDIELFPGTVADNIARFGEIDSAAMVAAARLVGVHDAILALPRGYETAIGDYGTQLSGGQRQQVGLARAVYRTPALVVLDEPNANLDGEGEANLLECLRALKQTGSTVVVISHRAGMLHAADQLLYLQEGRALAYGPRNEILARLGRLSAVPARAEGV